MTSTSQRAMPGTPTDAPTTMRAVVKESAAPGLTFTTDRPIPVGSTGIPGQPGPGEVLVRITLAGVCGTDRHIHEWNPWASKRIPVGIVTGHEFVGRIEKIGQGVQGLSVGQRVSAEGHIVGPKGNQGIGTDFNARTGNPHIAREMEIIGVDRDGCFAELLIIPAYNIWPVHDDIPDRWAAILDPLGNAVHTVMEAGVSAKNVLITGVGAIGMMSVMVARAAGAARIFAVDIDDNRLQLAGELGADETYNASDDSWVSQVQRATRGEGADALLEMSGHPTAFAHGFAALRNGGTASLLGTPSEPFTFDIASHIIFKAATVKGIHGRRMFETWYQMENLLLTGRIELDRVITHTMPLENINDAIKAMQSGEAIKPILTID